MSAFIFKFSLSSEIIVSINSKYFNLFNEIFELFVINFKLLILIKDNFSKFVRIIEGNSIYSNEYKFNSIKLDNLIFEDFLAFLIIS